MAIRKRILKSGNVVWLADYRDGAGVRRFKQFAKKSDAESYLAGVRVSLGKGTHVAPSASITFGEAAKLWLEKADKDGRERTTVTRYRQTYEVHVQPAFAGLKLTAISPPMIQLHIDKLAGTMSASSLKKVKGCIRQVFKYATQRGLATHNPAADIELPDTSRIDNDEVEMPTKAEVRAIIENAADRWKPLFRVAVLTGMRASELRGLRWTNVDLDRGVIRIVERVDRYGAFGPPKTKAGKRDIPLSNGTVKLLQEWRQRAPKTNMGLVFPNASGSTLDHQNILNRAFFPAQVKAGITVETVKKGKPAIKARYGLHALRHAAAALFIEQGLPPKRIQYIMGHSSIQMTFDLYGYLFERADNDRDAMAQIESGLFAPA